MRTARAAGQKVHCLAVPGDPEKQYKHSHRHNGEEDKRIPDEPEQTPSPWAEGNPLLLCPVCSGTMIDLGSILQIIISHELQTLWNLPMHGWQTCNYYHDDHYYHY